MARNSVLFEHPHTGATKKAFVGFSWGLLIATGALLTFSISQGQAGPEPAPPPP